MTSTAQPSAPDEQDYVVLRRWAPARSPGNIATVVAASLAAAAGAGAFFAGVLADAPPSVLGGSLALAFFALALAIRRLLAALYPRLEVSEERKAPQQPGGELAVTQPIARRTLLVRVVIGAAAVVAGGLAAPIASLAQRRSGVAQQTAWRVGVRLVDDDGTPVRVDDVAAGGLSRAWPEAGPRHELAAVFVVRLEGQLPEEPTNLEWVVDDALVAYSKVCTHAGCPVALYQAERGQLFCPCHQASFDVARGATPTFGPASRPLPQLPLGVDAEGYLIALGDFAQPVGPPVG